MGDEMDVIELDDMFGEEDGGAYEVLTEPEVKEEMKEEKETPQFSGKSKDFAPITVGEELSAQMERIEQQLIQSGDIAEKKAEVEPTIIVKPQKKKKPKASKPTGFVQPSQRAIRTVKGRKDQSNNAASSNARQRREKASKKYYEGEEDFDRNSFTLEGRLARMYEPGNGKVKYFCIEILNRDTGMPNFPEFVVFDRNLGMVDGLKIGDYVRVSGSVQSGRRASRETGIPYVASTFAAYRVSKTTPPRQTDSGAFLERFGIHEEQGTRRLNYSIVSGIVSDIRIKGKSIQFVVNSKWNDFGGDSVKIYYYPKGGIRSEIFDTIFDGNRVVVIGHITTSRAVNRDANDKKVRYIQQITADTIKSYVMDKAE